MSSPILYSVVLPCPVLPPAHQPTCFNSGSNFSSEKPYVSSYVSSYVNFTWVLSEIFSDGFSPGDKNTFSLIGNQLFSRPAGPRHALSLINFPRNSRFRPNRAGCFFSPASVFSPGKETGSYGIAMYPIWNYYVFYMELLCILYI